MSEAAGENGNDNDSIPSLEGSSLGEIGNWMRVKLDFNVPDTGPYEQTQRDLLESATKGVNQNVMWTVTRTYGYNKKDPNWGEKKLIKIKFNAQFEGLEKLMGLVEKFTSDLITMEADEEVTNVKETDAKIEFIVDDGGSAYDKSQVDLIRKASSGQTWTVSRFYNSNSGQKTVTFKVYFNYKVASLSNPGYPGLEKFTTTLSEFIKSFTISESVEMIPADVVCRTMTPEFLEALALKMQFPSMSSSTHNGSSDGRYKLPHQSRILQQLLEAKRSGGARTAWVAEDAMGFNVTFKLTREDILNDIRPNASR